MKAIVQDRYGSADVLELPEIDTPAARDDEVLVRVRAASVHADVWHVMRGCRTSCASWVPGCANPKNRVPARMWPAGRRVGRQRR